MALRATIAGVVGVPPGHPIHTLTPVLTILKATRYFILSLASQPLLNGLFIRCRTSLTYPRPG